MIILFPGTSSVDTGYVIRNWSRSSYRKSDFNVDSIDKPHFHEIFRLVLLILSDQVYCTSLAGYYVTNCGLLKCVVSVSR